MSEFVVNKDMFGRYARIKTDYNHAMHIYKIVSAFESNSYCNVPILHNSEPVLHDEILPVLNVIHCGIEETKIVRVAVKDCDIIPAVNEWISVKDRLPEEMKNVLAFGVEHNNNYCAWLNDGKWYYYKRIGEREEIFDDKITHWMQLPQPPEE